jgi:nucleotide-binding universal stress UspA family protein
MRRADADFEPAHSHAFSERRVATSEARHELCSWIANVLSSWRSQNAVNTFKTILVALDFGRHSEAALNEALRLADLLKATVHLLHVFTLNDNVQSASTPRGFHNYLQDSEQAQLKAAGSRCRASGKLGAVIWETGDPAGQILLTAEAVGAEMLVLGASGRKFRTRQRLGSVVEAVVRRASCTVLIVRDPSHSHADN